MADELKEVLASVWKDMMARQRSLDADRIVAAWEEAVGPRAASHARIAQLTNKKIHVNVDSPVWLHEFTLKKNALTRALRAVADIDDIVFKIGSVKADRSA